MSKQSSDRLCHFSGIAEQRRRSWHQWYNPRLNQRTEYLTQPRVKKRGGGNPCLYETQKEVLTDVLGPPAKVMSTDEMVKDVADQDRWYIVDRRQGRQVGRGRKDDREVEVLEHIKSEQFV